MSAENLEHVVKRAVEDEKFRALLFAQPEQALKGLVLSDEEIALLKSLSAEDFDAKAGELERRISRNRLI